MYQWLVNKVFAHFIEKNMEVYVDKMITKSNEDTTYIAYLHEIFTVLRGCGMKINPIKCVFEVRFDKFLGFMISSQVIEARCTLSLA